VTLCTHERRRAQVSGDDSRGREVEYSYRAVYINRQDIADETNNGRKLELDMLSGLAY